MTVIDSSLIEQVQTRLHAEGGRMTAQRRLILETLAACKDHPTAEEIYDFARAAEPTLHLSTVYRTLRWLEEEGLVSPRWFEDERRSERFDPVSQDARDHDHFRCRICNTIIEFTDPAIDEHIAEFQRSTGAHVENATFTLYGVCRNCLSAEQE